VALHQDVMVSQSRNLLRSLDVRELPSGYYVLRLHRTDSPATGGVPNQWAGTFPIIVTR
jgi:hypothetical protein